MDDDPNRLSTQILIQWKQHAELEADMRLGKPARAAVPAFGVEIAAPDIDKALDQIIAKDERLTFQRLATRLAQQEYPELITSELKKDTGADPRTSASAAANGRGKVLICSLAASFDNVVQDANEVRDRFPGVNLFIFATPRRVSNQTAENWSKKVRQSYGFDLAVISREDIVAFSSRNPIICKTILRIPLEIALNMSQLIGKVARASYEVTADWFAHRRLAGQPLIDLQAAKLEEGGRTGEIFGGGMIIDELLMGRRVVIEAPAGRGKTTTLIQLAKRIGDENGLALLIDLPEWAKSGRNLLDFITGLSPFTRNSVDPVSLARVASIELFSLLFNGWNELSEAAAERAESALRAVDREFATAGILVATRAHSIRPPFLGALRVALLPLTRAERTDYLEAALGERAQELDFALTNNRALDELTRTPFILREVTKLFRAGRSLPTTKIGILQSVVQLLEETTEHYNELRREPLSGNSAVYLSALSLEMTARGDVTIPEPEARKICTSAGRQLVAEGQSNAVPKADAILDALCRHHVLERIEYPENAFRFEHQQFQEFYAALWLGHSLATLSKESNGKSLRFVKDYVNVPHWDEPLRMVAEKISTDSIDEPAALLAVDQGKRLIEMALHVDVIFAADLARLAGDAVWRKVAGMIAPRVRTWYGLNDANHKRCALAAMFASGAVDFGDIILPLISSADQQVRLHTYRTWPQFSLSTLGKDWQKVVSQWKEDSRIEFLSELTINQRRTDVAEYFSLNDPSAKVRIEATKVLGWMGASEQVVKACKHLPQADVNDALLRLHREEIPPSLRPTALAAYQSQLATVTDAMHRIRNLLGQLELGGTNIIEALKSELVQLPAQKMEYYDEGSLRTALKAIQESSGQWVSEWVADRVASGSLWHRSWEGFITSIPESQKNLLLNKIGTEVLEHRDRQIIAVLSAVADVPLAHEIFLRICGLRRQTNGSGHPPNQVQATILGQLEDLLRIIPPITMVGSLSGVFSEDFDAVKFRVITELLDTVGREASDLKGELPAELCQGLRRYLKSGVPFALSQDDPSGRLLANLASALARVGERPDMTDLYELIQGDLKRLRHIQEARSRGQRIQGVGGYSRWYLEAVMLLDPGEAETVLLTLLGEEEYEVDAAKFLLSLATGDKAVKWGYAPKRAYSLIWKTRDGQAPTRFIEGRRERFSAALAARLSELLTERAASREPARYAHKILELAAVLGALDGRASADLVLQAVALPARLGGWLRVAVLESLLYSGVNLRAQSAATVLEAVIEEVRPNGFYIHNQDLGLLKSVLCLLPFVDNPESGISWIRKVVEETKFPRHELPDIISALGYSRSPAALAFLREIAGSDATGIQQMVRAWIEAVANLGGPESKELLLAFLDPREKGFSPQLKYEHDDAQLLASKIADIARSDIETERHILRLSNQQLGWERRSLLLKVIAALGTSDAILAGIVVISGGSDPPIPYELRKAFESLILEHRPFGTSGNTYTIVPRSANEVRRGLFELVLNDPQRRRSAFALLGQIDVWHLEHGKPNTEPRHPGIESGVPWPPLELFTNSLPSS